MPTPKPPLTINQAKAFLFEYYGLDVVRQTIFLWIKRGILSSRLGEQRIRLKAERIRHRWLIQEKDLHLFLQAIL